MLSLSIFSSSKSVSLAISKEKKIIKFIEKNDNQKNKSNTLLILIQNILKEYELGLFKNIIFSRGPGGFTSIRSLIAISQGLCLSSNIKLLSVTTFELLLCQLTHKEGITLICFKESRRDFYYQFYIYEGGEWKKISKIFSGFQDEIKKKIILFSKKNNLQKINVVTDSLVYNLDNLLEVSCKRLDVDATSVMKSFFFGYAKNTIRPIYHHPHYAKRNTI